MENTLDTCGPHWGEAHGGSGRWEWRPSARPDPGLGAREALPALMGRGEG